MQEPTYLLFEADCTHKLTYYYSCACGEQGSETFEVGDFFHDYVFEVVDNAFLKQEANCDHGALYYKSCACGLHGEQTFESGYARHTYDQKVEDPRYLYAAANCQKGTAYYQSCVCGEASYPLFYAGEPNPDKHSYSGRVTYPSKYAGGYTLYRCACGDNYTADFTEPTGSRGLEYTTEGCESGTCMVSGYGKYSDDNDGVIVIPSTYNGLTVVGIADATGSYKNIPTGVFFNLTFVTKIVLPDTLKYIGTGAFYECDNIREIETGKGLERIAAYAFYNCYALLHLTLPEGFRTLDDNALYNSYLRSINLPTSIQTIRRSAFSGAPSALCIFTEHATMPSSWTFVPTTNNYYTVILGVKSHGTTEEGLHWVKRADDTVLILGSSRDIANLIIPAEIDGAPVTEIAKEAFKSHSYNHIVGGDSQRIDYLKTVVLPDTVTLIGQSAFYDCRLLTSVTLSANLVKIDNYAFEGCYLLANLTLPDTLEYIGREAFYKCYAMTKIFVPKSVTYVDYNALYTSTWTNREYHYYIESASVPATWDTQWYTDYGDIYLHFGASRESLN